MSHVKKFMWMDVMGEFGCGVASTWLGCSN